MRGVGRNRTVLSLTDEDRRLACMLEGLAHEVRLALLRELRVPKALREIRVASSDSPVERPLSRQAVSHHLGKLMGIGVVGGVSGEREYGETTEYLLNHQALFALAEDVRALAMLRPVDDRALRQTAPRLEAPASSRSPGARFVIARGLHEGASFPLDATDPPDGGGWIVGRRRGVAIELDYDPFVSSENSLVRRDGSEVTIETLPASRNGTTRNFHALAPGERARLRHGDLVGVGRSLLVYWDD